MIFYCLKSVLNLSTLTITMLIENLKTQGIT